MNFPDYTPSDVAALMMKLVGVQYGHKVLEPSAGTGILAVKAQLLGAIVYCIELNEEMTRHLFDLGFPTKRADFMTVDHFFNVNEEKFDRVVMNPPSMVCASHIEHALEFLKPNGKLACLIKTGSDAPEAEHLLKYLLSIPDQAIESHALPEGTFGLEGIDVPAAILIIDNAKRLEIRGADVKGGSEIQGALPGS